MPTVRARARVSMSGCIDVDQTSGKLVQYFIAAA